MQAGQPSMSPPPGQAGWALPMQEFMHGWGPASLARGSWPACLLVELLVEGTICMLAFNYIGYTLSDQIIMHSEIIIIWPLSVYID